MDKHNIVSHQEWTEARRMLLAKEKEFTKERDRLTQMRRDLPWERVEQTYVFDGPGGKQTLAELFDGRSQLIVYHFMYGPDWDAGCPHCSRWADNFNAIIVHLNHRDVTMVAVSRAPYEKLAAYKKRLGWSFKWVSSLGTEFNSDYQASFTPDQLAAKDPIYNFGTAPPQHSEHAGVSVFYQDDTGQVFHTYSAYARGIEDINLDYRYLDMVPKGRDEGNRGPFWVRRHDEYKD